MGWKIGWQNRKQTKKPKHSRVEKKKSHKTQKRIELFFVLKFCLTVQSCAATTDDVNNNIVYSLFSIWGRELPTTLNYNNDDDDDDGAETSSCNIVHVEGIQNVTRSNNKKRSISNLTLLCVNLNVLHATYFFLILLRFILIVLVLK